MRLTRYEYPAPTDFDRVFGALFPATARFGGVFDAFSSGALAGSPAADLYEDADNYHVKVELPGVRKEDIRVELENDVLTVAATRVDQSKDSESRAGYNRRLAVPEGIDPARVQAAYQNGVLTVTLPKPEGRKPRPINVA